MALATRPPHESLRSSHHIEGGSFAWNDTAEIYKAGRDSERLLGWHVDRGPDRLAHFKPVSTEWDVDADWIEHIAQVGTIFDPIDDLIYENPKVKGLLQKYPQLADALRRQDEWPDLVDVTQFLTSLAQPAPTAEELLSPIQHAPLGGLFQLSGKLKITNKLRQVVRVYSVPDDGGRAKFRENIAPGESITVDCNDTTDYGFPAVIAHNNETTVRRKAERRS